MPCNDDDEGHSMADTNSWGMESDLTTLISAGKQLTTTGFLGQRAYLWAIKSDAFSAMTCTATKHKCADTARLMCRSVRAKDRPIACPLCSDLDAPNNRVVEPPNCRRLKARHHTVAVFSTIYICSIYLSRSSPGAPSLLTRHANTL